MCHADAPAGGVVPEAAREEVLVSLPNGEEMPALLTRPKGGEGPAVLIANDAFGRSPFYETLAARLAEAGFIALCPEYFFRLPPLDAYEIELARARGRQLDMKRTVEDLDAALGWLKRQPGVRGSRMGAVGFCMGGTFVLDLAAQRDDLAVACFYGFPAGSGQGENASPVPLSLVDRMRGPIIGFWGDQDQGVGMDNVHELARALEERGVDFEHTIYPGLGHGFLALADFDPNHQAYEAAGDAWRRTLTFFRQKLDVRASATG